MKYEEAAVKAEISRKEAVRKFCPLLQDYCTEKCVAFRDARIMDFEEPPMNWGYVEAHCTAYAIVGPL